jgi:hypothetical protein
MYTVDGDLISGCELFDEADLDAALARFEELHAQPPRLENATTRIGERMRAHFAARDWNAMAELLADDICTDDRRRIVGAGIRHGRDAEIAGMKATAEVGTKNITGTVLASRGESLALSRTCFSGHDQSSATFLAEVLGVVETNADNMIKAVVVFDLDDIEGAFAELDARYLAGEAAVHAHTWSVISQAYAALNRRALPATTPDWTSVDHRHFGTIEPNALTPNIRAFWDITSEARIDVATVHRLTNLGAVVAHTTLATSREGVEIESSEIIILMVDVDLLSRCEIFNEADLDAALARFEELSRPPTRLENAATRTVEQFFAHFGVRDWDAMAELLADDVSADDRRSVVNAGIRRGRDLEMANWRATDDLWTINVRTTVATRGERLALVRFVFTSKDREPQAFSVAALAVVEINDSNRIAEIVAIEADDIDTAFAELDARYLAGEAVAHSHTWALIMRAFSGLNQHELPPTTPGWVNIDHRSTQRVEADDRTARIRATWEVVPHGRVYIEAVHRLNDTGLAITYFARGTSQTGFDAEWRAVNVSTVDGDMISRSEIFDETDIDAALARFDELSFERRRLENAATQVINRVNAYFAARNWAAMAEALAQNMVDHDRRSVVNAGIRRGRDVEIANSKAVAELGGEKITGSAIATRGGRLALCRTCIFLRDKQLGESRIEFLSVIEIDADVRLAAHVAFDLENIETALAELDARYVVGEASAHAQTWALVARAYAALNRRELPATTLDWVNIDHRRLAPIADGDLHAYLVATWDLSPQSGIYIEAVHRLDTTGAVVTHVVNGTSQQGFDAEWRTVDLTMYEGDKINRCEIFDEADIDAALARFDELHSQTRRLENAASHLAEYFLAYFAASDWDAMAKVLADNFSGDDRRRVVGAGIRHGRDAQIADLRAVADLGTKYQTPTVLATRGERLVLVHHRLSFRDQGPEGFLTDVLVIGEINADGQIVAAVSFDLDDIDAAFDELDARYLAGEAAAHADTWSVIVAAHARFNRQELPATTPDPVYIDHRPVVSIEGADLAATLWAVWDITPVSSVYIEAVHRLDQLGAVATQVLKGTSPEGLDAEWRMIDIFTVEGDLYSGVEIFDEADLDAALARFEELQSQAPRLENVASQVEQRFLAYFAARDWDAYAEILADDVCMDDRRRVVNAGVRHGRDAEIASQRAVADVGVTHFTSTVIAIRGQRLALGSYSVFDGWSGSTVLCVSETNAENQIVARVAFDPDDFDAAMEELEARYVAGEAAVHAKTWSTITRACTAFNRHEFPLMTKDSVNIDHRRVVTIETIDLAASMRAGFENTPDVTIYIEAVHRLSDLGAVVTQVLKGTSQQGFVAEWRMVGTFILEGDLVSRCEAFDEADLDTALARFDELQPQTPRLENAASRVHTRLKGCFAARDWKAMAELLAGDIAIDDRRRAVNSGIQYGRDAAIADMRGAFDVGLTNISLTVIATRGVRLELCRTSIWGQDRPDAFRIEFLSVVEINADERIVARVAFDLDDIDAAFAELDARYLAGEAAARAHTWTAIMKVQAAYNRHEVPPTTADCVNIDHRPGIAFAPGDATAYIGATYDVAPNVKGHLEAVHRLGNLGVVVTEVVAGTSQEGFAFEWREVALFAFEGDIVSRFEIFDEADLDAALARFDELEPQAPRLENGASQVDQRFWTHFAARDWAAMAELLADDISTNDRRRVVNAGVRHGRDDHVAEMRAVVEVGVESITSTVVAIRSSRLALTRIHGSHGEIGADELDAEVLNIIEIDADNRILARVGFDLDDIDAAFTELDARYLAGEASDNAHTWSVIVETYAVFNRHEVPPFAPDSVNIDHRRGIAFAPGELTAYIRAGQTLAPDSRVCIETVHRLSQLGAVVIQVVNGTSRDGFDAEWRQIGLLTVEGDRINRCELFDEADLDAALARFDELHTQAPRLGNAASQAAERFLTKFAARDWTAIAETFADNFSSDDRRRVVGAGVRHGRDAEVADLRSIADIGNTNVTSTPVATRGERLVLTHGRLLFRDEGSEAFFSESLSIVEVNADERIVALVSFDPDDIDAAVEELDARYLAGEAAAYAHTWSFITNAYATLNRHELPPKTSDWVTVDHRARTTFAGDGLTAYLRAGWDLTPDIKMYIEAVPRLSEAGAVLIHSAYGSSREGFDAEWRIILLLTIGGGLVKHGDLFDEADLDAALARFDELDRPASA